MNLTQLFSQGFEEILLEENLLFSISSFCSTIELFHSGTNGYICDEKYKPYMGRSWADYEAPEYLLSFWKKILKRSDFNFYHKNFGEFNFFEISIAKYKKGDELNWHNDYFGNFHINLCLYLSEWNQEGELEIGTWDLDENGEGIESTAKAHKTIEPKMGKIAVLLSSNPTFCHRVKSTEDGRFTLMCRAGFI
jgi:Rps23 Pro-64 3,4-dihydroxylase Tpa1-like proline 4-hydroxylase